MTDPDIGLCDQCGSDLDPRVPVPMTATIAGHQKPVLAWLCRRCYRDLALADRSSLTPKYGPIGEGGGAFRPSGLQIGRAHV